MSYIILFCVIYLYCTQSKQYSSVSKKTLSYIPVNNYFFLNARIFFSYAEVLNCLCLLVILFTLGAQAKLCLFW